MEGDLLKTFDTLPILESEKINDVTDQVPMTHAAGTVEQGDVGITPNILQSCTILRCNSDAKSANKVCEYVGGMPLTGSIEQCAGRTVLVIFTNGNDVETPQINYENASGPIILINQASNVTVGKGCWTAGSRQLFTIDGSAWVMHSNVAQQTSEYTILADGRMAYKKIINITTNGFDYYFFSKDSLRQGFNYNNCINISMTVLQSAGMVITPNYTVSDGYIGLGFNRESSDENISVMFNVLEII